MEIEDVIQEFMEIGNLRHKEDCVEGLMLCKKIKSSERVSKMV